MVERAEPRSYYGRPVIKPPVWTWQVPWYLFAGGMAGASAPLAFGARLTGNRELSRSAWLASMAGLGVSPPLLITDLGRPERFFNMLRVFKPTSPMSLGSWALSAAGGAVALATLEELTGRFPRAGLAAGATAAAVGPFISTYTGALFADTSVPAWHEARRELPFLFTGGSLASAGAAATLLTSPANAAPARRMVVGGVALQFASMELMKRRLGALAEPYRSGAPARLGHAAQALNAGAVALMAARRPRLAAPLALAGAACERWSVFKAGFASARDPRYTVGPQRARL